MIVGLERVEWKGEQDFAATPLGLSKSLQKIISKFQSDLYSFRLSKSLSVALFIESTKHIATKFYILHNT